MLENVLKKFWLNIVGLGWFMSTVKGHTFHNSGAVGAAVAVKDGVGEVQASGSGSARAVSTGSHKHLPLQWHKSTGTVPSNVLPNHV